MTTTNDINNPSLCAQRAADPEWQAEQQAKNDAAVARFAAWCAEIDRPLFRRGPEGRV